MPLEIRISAEKHLFDFTAPQNENCIASALLVRHNINRNSCDLQKSDVISAVADGTESAQRYERGGPMQLEPLANVAEIAERAAAIIAERARVAFRERGRFTIALSGGPSTTEMIHRWGKEEVPWGKVFVFEISEPIPPPGHPAAYFPRLREALVQDTPIDPRQIYPMPVSAVNPLVGIRRYARKIERLAGCPAVIDLIYVVLDTDGDALKLVPGNPMLQVTSGDIGIALCQEKKRMTLTCPVFKRARQIVWVVTETDTAKALLELDSAAVGVQGSRGGRDYALIFADHAVWGTRLAASRRVQ